MEKWKKITYMTAVYMFLIEFRPIEPYWSAYLTGPHGNVPLSEVAYVIEAIRSYSGLIVAIFMSVSADYFLYKPNLIFLTIWTCISYLVLAGYPSVTIIRVSTVGIGAITNYSVLAYSYVYAQIEGTTQLQMATGIVTASVQLGRVTGNLLAQLITTTTDGNYTLLPYATAFSLFLAIIWVSLLPNIKRKKYVLNTAVGQDEKSPLLKKSTDNTTEIYGGEKDQKKSNKNYDIVKITLQKERNNFKTSYSNPIVLKYSVWFMFGMSGYVQVLSNKNVLYSYVVQRSAGKQNVDSNGLAEALVTLFGAAGAYLMGQSRVDWTRYGDLFIVICSTVLSALMLSCYFDSQLYLVYLTFILFELTIQAIFVLTITEIAKHLTNQCYSLIFECNFIIVGIISNCMMLILIQYNFMGVTIPGRFLFISGLYVAIGVLFSFNIILGFGKKKTVF